MLPGVFDFAWDTGHVVFLGAFFLVLATMLVVVATVTWRSARRMRDQAWEAVGWHEAFESLPKDVRACRHHLTGEIPGRVCENGFDCRACEPHAALVEKGATVAAKEAGENGGPSTVLGFDAPLDRYYHRGHTWVRRARDGTLVVGLDDLASRLVGRPDAARLPEPGEKVRVNGTGWLLEKGGSDVRVLSPVEGTVVATGGPKEGWYLRVRPAAEHRALTHLLRGDEVGPWLSSEIERLQTMLAPAGLGAVLADGGAPVADFPAAEPGRDWDAVWGEMLLDA